VIWSRERKPSTPVTPDGMRLKVLVLTDFFFPAPGGGYRAVANLVEPLTHSVAFSFLTTPSNDARDGSLPGVTTHDWRKDGEFCVRRIRWRFRSLAKISAAIRSERADIILLTSLMSRFSSLLLIWRGPSFLSRRFPPVVLMPQGELMDGALAIRSRRKFAYLRVLRLSTFTRNVHWWASTEEEKRAILRWFPSAFVHHIQIPPPLIVASKRPMPDRGKGCRILFASSVSPKKRPSVLIEALSAALRLQPTSTTLTMCGSVHDQREQDRCVDLMALAPACLQFEILGPLEPNKVAEQIQACHILALPTLGENYGYIIIEALANSRPVLAGRETPWTEILSSGAGEVVEDSVEAWTESLSRWLAFDGEHLQNRSEQAFGAALEFLATSQVPQQAQQLFETLLGRNN
jgi:glycosyltransferase involved in cell wall biosynthesis